MEFTENEEHIDQQTDEWLSIQLCATPDLIKSQETAFHIDPYTRIFINDKGESTYLTAKEFDLLYFLFCHKGQVFTKDQLYENIWGYNYISDTKNLTSFIRKLRKKIEPFPDCPQYILTVWAIGYKFNEKKRRLCITIQ